MFKKTKMTDYAPYLNIRLGARQGGLPDSVLFLIIAPYWLRARCAALRQQSLKE